MTKFHDTFAKYLARVEKAQGKMRKSIVVSTDVKTAPLLAQKGIKRMPIAWPLHKHNMFYVVTVPPNSRIKSHSHDEDVFRYLSKGSLVLNGSIQIKEGMWFVVKANTSYNITTKSGYTAVAGYQFECH